MWDKKNNGVEEKIGYTHPDLAHEPLSHLRSQIKIRISR
jgi:hypothetical protein